VLHHYIYYSWVSTDTAIVSSIHGYNAAASNLVDSLNCIVVPLDLIVLAFTAVLSENVTLEAVVRFSAENCTKLARLMAADNNIKNPTSLQYYFAQSTQRTYNLECTNAANADNALFKSTLLPFSEPILFL
jgi:hypothetical protein